MASCLSTINPLNRFRAQKVEEMPPQPADKPLENLNAQSNNLPGLTNEQAAQGLVALVDHSQAHTDVSQGIHASSHTIFSIPWIHRLIPGIEKLATAYHIGNFVAIRGSKEQIFEATALYPYSLPQCNSYSTGDAHLC
jgi:phosphatidylserine decarboxylase